MCLYLSPDPEVFAEIDTTGATKTPA